MKYRDMSKSEIILRIFIISLTLLCVYILGEFLVRLVFKYLPANMTLVYINITSAIFILNIIILARFTLYDDNGKNKILKKVEDD